MWLGTQPFCSLLHWLSGGYIFTFWYGVCIHATGILTVNWGILTPCSLSIRSVMPPNSDQRPNSALVSSSLLSSFSLAAVFSIPSLIHPPSINFPTLVIPLVPIKSNAKAKIYTHLWDNSERPCCSFPVNNDTMPLCTRPGPWKRYFRSLPRHLSNLSCYKLASMLASDVIDTQELIPKSIRCFHQMDTSKTEVLRPLQSAYFSPLLLSLLHSHSSPISFLPCFYPSALPLPSHLCTPLISSPVRFISSLLSLVAPCCSSGGQQ